MKRYLTVLALLLQMPAWAQSAPGKSLDEEDILKCSAPRPGIYQAFQEFRRNAPSITQEFIFLKNQRGSKPYLEAEKDRLQLLDPRGRTSRVQHPVWGFCDSTEIYIYFEDEYQLGKRYNRLQNVGRYSYFIDEYDMPQSNAKGRPRHIRREYVLNINDGKCYEFSAAAMKRILSKDTELLRRFEKEKEPEAAKHAYLMQFNQRNPDTVIPIR